MNIGAYERGIQDWHTGALITDCPSNYVNEECTAWCDGWLAAEGEKNWKIAKILADKTLTRLGITPEEFKAITEIYLR